MSDPAGATEPVQFTQATALDFIDQHLDADREIMSALSAVKDKRKHRKDLREEIKEAGISLHAFDEMLEKAKLSGSERELRDRQYRALMSFIGKPIGHQGMFDLGPQSAEYKLAAHDHRLRSADAEGHKAGLAGDKIDTCTWPTGSEEAAVWMTAWQRGQRARVEQMGEPPEKRGRGRPRKAATPSTPANGHAEPDPVARNIGHADGLENNRERADHYPPGAAGHADYELGHVAGMREGGFAA
jgi:ribosome modulation factor